MPNPNPPQPGFIRIDYHTKYAPHVMTIPTRQPAYTAVNTIPTYDPWSGGAPLAGNDMLNALVADMRAYVPATTVFDQATYYDNAPGSTRPKPIYIQPINEAGTATLVGWDEAVQRTYLCITAGFGVFKFVLLDTPTDNLFGKYTDVSPDEDAILGNFFNPDNAWQARDGTIPTVLKNLTITLNDRLRREYHLS